MLKTVVQTEMSLSPYEGLYEAIIPTNHMLRRLKENIDFSFVNPMLKKQYCEHYGRPAKEPEMMFKLLFLKKIYDLSDERVISSAQTDMAYKYFLGLSPEDKMVDPSLLTKFRKTRITEDILEELLKAPLLYTQGSFFAVSSSSPKSQSRLLVRYLSRISRLPIRASTVSFFVR